MTQKLPIAVLISGGGTTLKNLLDWQAQGKADFEVRLVISSSGKAAGLEYARRAGIPHQVVVQAREDASGQQFSSEIFQACDDHEVRYVAMGGFLKLLPIPERFIDRVFNIHPSLIPAFCGKGFYGSRVHQGVLDYGCKLSGCTVHLVDNEFDHGPIVAQVAVEVRAGDTADLLQKRVFEAECQLYPEILNRLASGRLVKQGRWIEIVPR